MRVELKHRLFWYVVIKAKNGQTLLTSETYFSRGNAKRAAVKLALALEIKYKETK